MIYKLKNFIPDKLFLKRYFKIVTPIVAQQILINSAIVIDNLMVGKLGQEQVVAIGAVNAIHFFFMFAMYGSTTGCGIYITQFNGSNQKENLKKAAGIKQLLLLLYSIITIAIIWIFAPQMVKAFIKDIPENQLAIKLAISYYKIFVISVLFKSQNFGYSTTFQELGLAKKGLYASSASVVVNILVNFVLIFGLGPIPALGLVGAAYGTVISKIASFLTWNFLIDTSFVKNRIYKIIFYFDKEIYKKVIRKTVPVFITELLWSLAMVIKTQIFASYGTVSFAAITILGNVETFAGVVWAGLWGGTVYLVGKKLGRNNLDHAEERALKLIGTTFFLSIAIGVLIFLISFPMLSIYNVSTTSKNIAFKIIAIMALSYPIRLMTGAFFFIIRTSGLTKETMQIDLVSAWLIMLPVMLSIKNFTTLSIIGIFICVELTNIIKLYHAYYHFKNYKWLRSLIK